MKSKILKLATNIGFESKSFRSWNYGSFGKMNNDYDYANDPFELPSLDLEPFYSEYAVTEEEIYKRHVAINCERKKKHLKNFKNLSVRNQLPVKHRRLDGLPTKLNRSK